MTVNEPSATSSLSLTGDKSGRKKKKQFFTGKLDTLNIDKLQL